MDVKFFPAVPEHCIVWALNEFAGAFSEEVGEAVAFAKDPAGWLAMVGAESATMPFAASSHTAWRHAFL